MNIQEFAALKPGDKIDNPMSGSNGTVSEVNDRGVFVRWQHKDALAFFYPVNTTAWMHWRKTDDDAA